MGERGEDETGGSILLSDKISTTGSLVSIIQNDFVSFSFLQLTYLGIAQACCSIASTLGFWYFQKYFKIRTKYMFLVTNFFSVLIPFWGMLGLWTRRIGYHHKVRYMLSFFVYDLSIFPTNKSLPIRSGSFISTTSYSDYSKLPTMR